MRGTEASPRIASWTSKWLHGTLYMTIRSSAVGTYSPAGIAAGRGISMQRITPRLDAPRERPRHRVAVRPRSCRRRGHRVADHSRRRGAPRPPLRLRLEELLVRHRLAL